MKVKSWTNYLSGTLIFKQCLIDDSRLNLHP